MLREPRSWLAKEELLSIRLEGALNALFVLGLASLENCLSESRVVSPNGFCVLFEAELLKLRSLVDGLCRSLARLRSLAAGFCRSLRAGC
jgi:hypothetical protein